MLACVTIQHPLALRDFYANIPISNSSSFILFLNDHMGTFTPK